MRTTFIHEFWSVRKRTQTLAQPTSECSGGPVSQKSRNVSGLNSGQCHNSPFIFATPMFWAIQLRNSLIFFCSKNILKDQLFKTSGLQIDNFFTFRTRKVLGTFEKQRHYTFWRFPLDTVIHWWNFFVRFAASEDEHFFFHFEILLVAFLIGCI